MEILLIVGLGLVFILVVFGFFNKKNTDWMIKPEDSINKNQALKMMNPPMPPVVSKESMRLSFKNSKKANDVLLKMKEEIKNTQEAEAMYIKSKQKIY
jgi:hypothetical protein